MVVITIVAGAYKPTYILGASHCILASPFWLQEYLLEQQEAAEDALHTGKAPKEQTQSVQKLLENVINGANVDKVPGIFMDFTFLDGWWLT